MKFSFERARAPNSTNKAKLSFFANIKSITTPDAHTVVLVLDDAQAGLRTPIGSHFSPMDLGYVDLTNVYPDDPAKPRALLLEAGITAPLAVPKMSDKGVLWRDIQRQIAEDAVNVFIWNPAQVAVSRRGLRGLWSSSPIVVNDMAAVSWAPPPTR